MADLTTLEEKLAEVTGLAGAAQEATRKVESLLDGSGVQGLVDWALPIQERHLATVRDGSLELAAEEDPNS
jgi:hypothetical protein